MAPREDEISGLFADRYVPLCRTAYLLLADAALAEDVVMEAFLKTYASWRSIRDPERAGAYVRRTVVNLALNRLRRRGRERAANERAAATVPPVQDETVLSAGPLWDAVRRLPVRQRAAVVLRYYEDLSEADVAKALGCARGTVKSQLSKARAALAAQVPPLVEEGT